MLLSEEEILQQPYSYSAKEACDVNKAALANAAAEEELQRNKRKREEEREAEKGRRKDERTEASKKKSKHDNNESSGKKQGGESWLRNGIRVKIITKKLGDQFYLQKCSVLDVYGQGLASVRLDSGKVRDVACFQHLLALTCARKPPPTCRSWRM